MDVVSLVVGFIIGVILAAFAIEIGIKKSSDSTPSSKHTKKWSISEISNPRIIAEFLSDVDLPKNSKVVVNKYLDKDMLSGLNVREHRGIKGNFVVGDDRALILAGPVKKDEVAFWTIEPEIVKKLNQEFDKIWSEADEMNFAETKK